MRLRPGLAHPLGAHWDGEGVNFAVFSAHATAIELCLFDADGRETRHPLPARSGDVFHGHLSGAGPGLRYGLRAHGPWEPEAWLRFDPSKLLVDPRARALEGTVRWHEALVARPDGATPTPDTAPWMPRCLVVDDSFDWQGDRPPRTPWSETVLYECHVKGTTVLHPGVPEASRGRFAGLTAPALIDHLKGLGVTAVSLLPVQAHSVDPHVGPLGLPNYWGYATLGFFAPDARYASGDDGVQVREFKEMVRALHAAGLEVILDVVYNHTPEGDESGATLSLRGLDERSYYRGDPERPGHLEDFTGCGNTLDTRHPRTLQLVLDSLRYWVGEMHVDGFRFDLGAALAREEGGAMRGHGRFLEALRHDPLLGGVKLIVEPWDLAPHGDCSGAFPFGIAEWNGRYRDAVRRFWRGDPGMAGELAARLAGSQDLYAWNGRPPQAGINYVTSHDGMTLVDLVSHSRRHNEANLEGNRDGDLHEVLFHTAVEGPVHDPVLRERRDRARRSLVATLACSQGVPMLSHGDELSRTQRGNNNAYCQDSPLTWLDWRLDAEREAFLDFVRRALGVRRANAVFRRRSFFQGDMVKGGGVRDIHWLRPDGQELGGDDWRGDSGQLAVWVPAAAADPLDERGDPQPARSVLMLLNASDGEARFRLPKAEGSGRWEARLETGPSSGPGADGWRVGPGTFVLLVWSEAP